MFFKNNLKNIWKRKETKLFFSSTTKRCDIFNNLKRRGMINDFIGNNLEEYLKTPRVVYCGFDPTASGLHIGNFLQIMALAKFQREGHKPIVLVGGGTGMIGDPSGRSKERNLLEQEKIRENSEGIKSELSRYLSFEEGLPNGAKMVNNFDWYKDYNILEFIRDVGKYFRVSNMLSKESVRSRMSSNEGISFTEFTYQIFQAYDFYHLWKTEGCTLQIGGSDQLGNILAGCELVRKIQNEESDKEIVFGITLPLVTNENGEKLGKSAGNAVWLDEEKTSNFQLYQYFFRTSDSMVEKYLHFFTFLTLDQIENVMKKHRESPEDHHAQKILSEEVTKFLRGEDSLKKANLCTQFLYGNLKFSQIDANDIPILYSDVPNIQIEKLEGKKILDVLSQTPLVSSKGFHFFFFLKK